MRVPLQPTRGPARLAAVLALAALPAVVSAQARPRARDLGIPLPGTPGPMDAITDILGVQVGHATLISGSGKLARGKGPVRTGVTAVFPRGKGSTDPVFAGRYALNGNGEMTGEHWMEESGFLWGPVVITNTMSIGVAYAASVGAHSLAELRALPADALLKGQANAVSHPLVEPYVLPRPPKDAVARAGLA